MTPADRTRLRALAQKATPGPWCWESHGEKSNDWTVGVALDENDCPITGEINDPDFIVEAVGNSEASVLRNKVVIEQENSRGFGDAAYIASCYPETVLALLDIADVAEATRAGLDAALYYADTWSASPDGSVMLVPSISTLDEARAALARLDAALGRDPEGTS